MFTLNCFVMTDNVKELFQICIFVFTVSNLYIQIVADLIVI